MYMKLSYALESETSMSLEKAVLVMLFCVKMIFVLTIAESRNSILIRKSRRIQIFRDLDWKYPIRSGSVICALRTTSQEKPVTISDQPKRYDAIPHYIVWIQHERDISNE